MQALKNFRHYFFRGLAALLPTIVTIWIFVQCYVFIQDKVSVYINRGLVQLILAATSQYEKDFLVGFWVNGPGKIAGFFLAIIGVCFIGAFLASVVGRTLWHFFERALVRIPLIKHVYPYIKQVTDFLLTKKELSFTRVVAVEYPRKGIWSIGLVTGQGLKKISVVQGKEFLTVFIPSSPTPFTGYVTMIEKDQVLEMDMAVDEAIRFIISGGVITPSEQRAFEQAREGMFLETKQAEAMKCTLET